MVCPTQLEAMHSTRLSLHTKHRDKLFTHALPQLVHGSLEKYTWRITILAVLSRACPTSMIVRGAATTHLDMPCLKTLAPEHIAGTGTSFWAKTLQLKEYVGPCGRKLCKPRLQLVSSKPYSRTHAGQLFSFTWDCSYRNHSPYENPQTAHKDINNYTHVMHVYLYTHMHTFRYITLHYIT